MARRRADAETPSTQASAAYLRAQFFARKLGELGFFGILDRIRELERESGELSWEGHEGFGVTCEAMDLVRDSGMALVRVFLHPDLLRHDPSIVLYYRCIGLLGRKNVYALAGTDIGSLEQGQRATVSGDRASRIAKAVNSAISLLVESVQPFGEEQIQAFLIASAGATLQGSWVNEIGKQGELLVKGIVVRGLWQHATEAHWADGTAVPSGEITAREVAHAADRLRRLELRSGHHCIFAQEPDVSVRDPRGLPVVAVEIKAGTDPAAALERNGAVRKSFANEIALNPDVKTILVANCITEELRRRIDQEGLYDHRFLMSDLVNEPRSRQRFINLLAAGFMSRRRR